MTGKSRPSWQPRSVLVGSWLGLGWILLAALAVEFGMPYDRAHSAPQRAWPEPPESWPEPGSGHSLPPGSRLEEC